MITTGSTILALGNMCEAHSLRLECDQEKEIWVARLIDREGKTYQGVSRVMGHALEAAFDAFQANVAVVAA